MMHISIIAYKYLKFDFKHIQKNIAQKIIILGEKIEIA